MATGARLVHTDLRATNTINGTQWKRSLTLDTRHSSWFGWFGHGANLKLIRHSGRHVATTTCLIGNYLPLKGPL